jgi:hypothetical protein
MVLVRRFRAALDAEPKISHHTPKQADSETADEMSVDKASELTEAELHGIRKRNKRALRRYRPWHVRGLMTAGRCL